MSESNAVTKVKEPLTLVKVGARTISPVGWKLKLAHEHLLNHYEDQASKQWCTIACMTKTMLAQNTEAKRKAIRRRINNLFHFLADKGLFLSIEYARTTNGHRGSALALKILDPQANTVSMERQHAQHQIDSMLRREEITKKYYDQAQALLTLIPHTMSTEEPQEGVKMPA